MNKPTSPERAIDADEREFGAALNSFLSPSRPLQSEEFLRGRAHQLKGIERAMYASGRHVLIHGLRGVGKSSLAQTAAYKLARGTDPIVVACDRTSSFQTIIREIFEEAVGASPMLAEKVRGGGFSLNLPWLGLNGKAEVKERPVETPLSVNDAVRLLQFLAAQLGEVPVFVVDEFDQLTSEQAQIDFTNLVKQIADKHISAHFIFCGIGESVEAIMAAHGSADRYFHAVELTQLPWEARDEIITHSATSLGIEIDRDTAIRIAMISDGFPHYIHFIAEKLFWRVWEAKNGGRVTPDLFGLAMDDAASAMDMKLRGPYEKATQKYGDDYAAILWASADGHQLKRRSADIFVSYQRIMEGLGQQRLDRTKFNTRINALKTSAHASILTGTRSGWYEFSEKMIRGYVRLMAERHGVVLKSDHPVAKHPLADF
ncbi:ATP-binding protein [Palleronia abyssalis]|nr:ATP-binding protein [Palleronia abyssalis]